MALKLEDRTFKGEYPGSKFLAAISSTFGPF